MQNTVDLKLGQLEGDIIILDTVCQRDCMFRHLKCQAAYLDVMTMQSDVILITTLHVPFPFRRQGFGTDLIKAIQTFNKPLCLSADPQVDMNHQVSIETLHTFYTQLGFKQLDHSSYGWNYEI
jgi:GNAT superfamily N-acetyltransferase